MELPNWVNKVVLDGLGRISTAYIIETVPNNTKLERKAIKPKIEDEVWICFGIDYGALRDPDGIQYYSESYEITYEHEWVKRFIHKMLPSVMDVHHSVFIVIDKDRPLYYVIENKSDVDGTVDVALSVVVFDIKELYEKFMKWYREKLEGD